MIDLSGISGFEWDKGNSSKNQEKHNVSRFEAEQVFFNQPLLVLDDFKHSLTESRFLALGKSDTGRLLHIAFTLRSNGQLIRVISARDMHRKEKVVYGQA